MKVALIVENLEFGLMSENSGKERHLLSIFRITWHHQVRKA